MCFPTLVSVQLEHLCIVGPPVWWLPLRKKISITILTSLNPFSLEYKHSKLASPLLALVFFKDDIKAEKMGQCLSVLVLQ
jgi:hypothetical protein